MTRSAGALPSLVVVAIAAALIPGAYADEPAPTDRPLASSLQVPFEATVPGACQGDLVALSGELHAVTRVRMTKDATLVDAYFQLNNVKGVGSVSGLRYLGLGTAQFTTPTDRGPPNLPSYRAGFLLWAIGRPSNPCIGDPDRVRPLPVSITMKFDTDGAIVGVQASIAR